MIGNNGGQGGGGGGATGSTNKFKPLTIGYAGDSIAVLWSREDGYSPIYWLKQLFYPCETKNVFSSALGGTPVQSLLYEDEGRPIQIDQLEAATEVPELLVVHTTQNNFFGSEFDGDQNSAILIEYCTRAFATGVKNIIIAGRPPKAGVDTAYAVEYFNRIMVDYAHETEGVHFIDVYSLWRKVPTTEDIDGNGVDWKPNYSDDTVHPTSKAMYEAGKLLPPILSPLIQGKNTPATCATEYDDVNTPYANLLNLNGLMLGTWGEYNGVDNVNVAGYEENHRWQLDDGNGVTATPSIVVGDDGYNYQQLVLGGTATAQQDIILKYSFAINPITEGTFLQEAIVHLNDITGVNSIRFGTDAIAQYDIMNNNMDLEGDNKLHITHEAVYGQQDWSTRSFTIRIRVSSGESPTGTIKLGRCGLYRQVDQG